MRHNKREKLKVTYSLKMAMLLVSFFLICANYAVGEQPNLTIKGNITGIPPGNPISSIYIPTMVVTC